MNLIKKALLKDKLNKNRTYYRKYKDGVMLKETVINYLPDDPINSIIKNVPPFVVGYEYDVIWDSVEYKSTAYEFNGGVVAGNMSIIGQGEDTGEPFLFGNEEGNLVYITNIEGEHTFSISGYHEEIKKIDSVFLPTIVKVRDSNSDYAPHEIFIKGNGHSFGYDDITYKDGYLKLAHMPLITTEYGEIFIETNANLPNLGESISSIITNKNIIDAIYSCYYGNHCLRARVGFTGTNTYIITFIIGCMWSSNPENNTDKHITGITCAIDGGIYTFQASFNNDKTSVTINIKRVV